MPGFNHGRKPLASLELTVARSRAAIIAERQASLPANRPILLVLAQVFDG